MTPAEALGRLAAAGRIRSAWLPGMGGVLPDGRHIRIANDHAPYWGGARLGNYVSPDTEPQDDPATVGGLLALLREAARDPLLYVQPFNAGGEVLWTVESDALPVPPLESTEHAAILSALEAVAKECL